MNEAADARDAVHQTLCDMLGTYGVGICDDPRRCEALLRDLCGEHKREINVLVTALRERVAVDLTDAGQGLPYAIIRSRLVQRLNDVHAIEPKMGSWSVDSWAVALHIISKSEYDSLTEKPFVQQREPTPPKPPQVSATDELREAIRAALADDAVTLEEKRNLKELSRRLEIPPAVANRILDEVIAERKRARI